MLPLAHLLFVITPFAYSLVQYTVCELLPVLVLLFQWKKTQRACDVMSLFSRHVNRHEVIIHK